MAAGVLGNRKKVIMTKVSIQIVTWNSKRYIAECLDALAQQTFTDFSVMVIDNGSGDGTVKLVRSEYPTVAVLENFRNLGFSKANNQGIKLSKSEYVLVMNPDVVLEPDFLEQLVACADSHPEAASFGGKVLKLGTQAIDHDDESGLRESVKSEIIDTAGLVLYKSRRAMNRGENEKDQKQYDRAVEVFGISGACVLYRRTLLNEVVVKNEYFDEDFFAYKEDVDLAWRLQLYGFTAWYTPQAVCYHHRGYGLTGSEPRQVARHRKAVSKLLRSLSFRNHHLTLIKNDQLANVLVALPWLILWELKILGYALLFERFQWKSIGSFFRLLPKMFLKRSVIMAHRKRTTVEMRKWIV